jgi:hypothetical protein
MPQQTDRPRSWEVRPLLDQPDEVELLFPFGQHRVRRRDLTPEQRELVKPSLAKPPDREATYAAC